MDERTLARFMGKVEVQPNGCWNWAGTIGNRGYGVFALGRSNRLAHRVSYEHYVGPIPEGFELDHLCHTRDLACPGGKTDVHRRCVNPAHLEVVTHRTNSLRGRGPSARNATKTHCINGHLYDEANTYVDPDGKRECRTCMKTKGKEWRRVHNPGVRHGTEAHCPQGHPYAGGNLYVPPNGSRRCLACKREQGRLWAAAKRAARRIEVDA